MTICGEPVLSPECQVFDYDRVSLRWNAATLAGFMTVVVALTIKAYPALCEALPVGLLLPLLIFALGLLLYVILTAVLRGCAQPTFDWPNQALRLRPLNPFVREQVLPFAEIATVEWRHIGFWIRTHSGQTIELSAIYLADWQRLKALFEQTFPNCCWHFTDER